MAEIDIGLVKFDEKGLVPVIVQDRTSAEILMAAWANEEALRLTADSGELTLWSRSRKELWRKGGTSGNVMKVFELRTDCDGDTLLAVVEPSVRAMGARLFLPFDMGKRKLDRSHFPWTALALSRHKEVRRSKRELHRETPRRRTFTGSPEGRRGRGRNCDRGGHRRQGGLPV